MDEIYRGIAHFLTYQGIYLHRGQVRNRYWEILRQQKEEGKEEYSEIDKVKLRLGNVLQAIMS